MPGKARSGTLKFKGGSWKVRVTEGGKRPWYDLKTTDRATAERRLDGLITRIDREEKAAREGAEPAVMPRFKTAAMEWLARREAQGVASVKSDEPLLERYAFPIFGGALVGDVTPGHVRDALEKAKAAGRKRGTLKHLHGAISAVLHRGWQDGHAAENVALKADIPETKETKKVRVVLTDDEIARFWASPKADLEIKLLSLVSRVEGGARTLDLVLLGWEHLSPPAFDACTILRNKTGTPQTLEVPFVLRAPISAWWEQHGRPVEGPVFPVLKGPRRGERRRERGVSFAKRLRRNLIAAGIVRLTPVDAKTPHPRDPIYHETAATRPVDFHSFRRAFAQALDTDGITRKAAMQLTGHASEDAHLRYLKRAGQSADVLPLPAAVVPIKAAPSTDGIGWAGQGEGAGI